MVEAFELVKPKLQTLLNQSSEQEILNFREQVLGILDEASSHYTSVSAQYNSDPQDKEKLKLKLERDIKFHIKQSFDNQVRVTKNKTIESLKAKITEFEARPLEDI